MILKANYLKRGNTVPGELVVYRNLGGWSYRFNSKTDERSHVRIQIGGLFDCEGDAIIHFEKNYGELVSTPASAIRGAYDGLVDVLRQSQ